MTLSIILKEEGENSIYQEKVIFVVVDILVVVVVVVVFVVVVVVVVALYLLSQIECILSFGKYKKGIMTGKGMRCLTDFNKKDEKYLIYTSKNWLRYDCKSGLYLYLCLHLYCYLYLYF